jgi:hypothetical protein
LCRNAGPSTEVETLNPFVSEEAQHLVGRQRQIRRHDNAKFLIGENGPFFTPRDDESNETKIQERFTALKFQRELWRRAAKHQVYRALGCFFGHVVFDAIGGLPRDLAVVAGVITPQRNHENMELGKSVEKSPFRSILRRQNVKEGRRLIVEKKLARSQQAIEL